MKRYLAAVFSDLESHSLAWSRVGHAAMAATIAEYRNVAENLAGRYGCLHHNFTGDGHLFLFDNADAVVQFALRLIRDWRSAHERTLAGNDQERLALRMGCHFGHCERLEDGTSWVGRAIVLAKRVEDVAEPDTLFVTENLLELLDLPLYRFDAAGSHRLKGDHLPNRTLYRISDFDAAGLAKGRGSDLSAEAWFLKAVTLKGSPEEGGDLEAEYYREALRRRGDYPEVHNNLAVLLREKGELGSAATHYREALRLRPDYVDVHHALANLLRARGELLTAAAHYEEVLRLRPRDAEAHNNYAILLEDLSEEADAEAHYRETLEIRPTFAEARYNLALFLEGRDRTAEATEQYEEALRLRPDYPEALNNLAALLHTAGELDRAEEHYRSALRLRPDDPEAHYNYGLLLRAKGDEAAAREHFRVAHEVAPDTAVFRSIMKAPD